MQKKIIECVFLHYRNFRLTSFKISYMKKNLKNLKNKQLFL